MSESDEEESQSEVQKQPPKQQKIFQLDDNESIESSEESLVIGSNNQNKVKHNIKFEDPLEKSGQEHKVKRSSGFQFENKEDSVISDSEITNSDYVRGTAISNVDINQAVQKISKKGLYTSAGFCCFIGFGSIMLWVILFR